MSLKPQRNAQPARPTGEAPGQAGPDGGPTIRRAWRLRPHWLQLIAGRWIQRVCASARDNCQSEHCRLRLFCKCAREEYEAAVAAETRVYAVLLGCSLAVVLYWLLSV